MEQLLEYIKEYEETEREQKLPRKLSYEKDIIYIFGIAVQLAGPFLISKPYGFVEWMIKHHPGLFEERIKKTGSLLRTSTETYVKEEYTPYNNVACAYTQLANAFDPVGELKYLFGIY